MLEKPFAAKAAMAALFLLATGCSGDGQGNKSAPNQSDAAVPTEAEAAALAAEAADAEAADTAVFGGNAAAGETGNAF